MAKKTPTKAPKGARAPAPPVETEPLGTGSWEINPALLSPSPLNPRKRFDPDKLEELAASLKAHGMLQPIVIRLIGKTPSRGTHYEIVAGERRWRAAQRAGLKSVPVIQKELTDQQALELMCVENDQRSDVSPVERARAYRALLDATPGLTQKALAARLGRSETAVRDALALTQLPAGLLEFVDRGLVPPSAAALLVRVPEADGLRERAALGLVGGKGSVYPAGPADESEPARRARLDTAWAEHLEMAEANPDLCAVTFADARGFVHCLARDLRGAHWDLGDAELVPEAGACDGCPKRQDEASGGKKSCLDPGCYSRKQRSWLDRRAAECRAEWERQRAEQETQAGQPGRVSLPLQQGPSNYEVRERVRAEAVRVAGEWAQGYLDDPFANGFHQDGAWRATVEALVLTWLYRLWAEGERCPQGLLAGPGEEGWVSSHSHHDDEETAHAQSWGPVSSWVRALDGADLARLAAELVAEEAVVCSAGPGRAWLADEVQSTVEELEEKARRELGDGEGRAAA